MTILHPLIRESRAPEKSLYVVARNFCLALPRSCRHPFFRGPCTVFYKDLCPPLGGHIPAFGKKVPLWLFLAKLLSDPGSEFVWSGDTLGWAAADAKHLSLRGRSPSHASVRPLRAKILRRSRRNAECDEVRPICQNAPIHPSLAHLPLPHFFIVKGIGCENRCEKMSLCRLNGWSQ